MINYTKEQIDEAGAILDNAKGIAIQYYKLTGKPLGITSEIAEYEAAVKNEYILCPARTPGHDLIDKKGRRVQVKGRVVYDKKSHRVGTIKKNTVDKPWDYVLLVLLDGSYNPTAMYKANEKEIEEEFAKPRPKGGKSRRDMNIRDFIRIGNCIWQISGN